MKTKLLVFATALCFLTACEEEPIEDNNNNNSTGDPCIDNPYDGSTMRIELTDNPKSITTTGTEYKIYLDNTSECDSVHLGYEIIQDDFPTDWIVQVCLGIKCYANNPTPLEGKSDSFYIAPEHNEPIKTTVMSTGSTPSGTGTIAIKVTDLDYPQHVDTAYYYIDIQ